uniref:Ig-like domain-containing protein n=1 Tax=Neolamprologus brichardi TaxID=32507 RepID=A0A3Q4N687_NEOBR
ICICGSLLVKLINTDLFLFFLIPVEQFPPVFISKPDPQTVYVGKRAVMQCVIAGTAPLNVVWLKDNQALPKVPAHYQSSYEKNKHTLEIPSAEAADSGLYVCNVSNKAGTAECHMELCVIDKPNFVRPLASVAQGSTARLQCTIKGSPELHSTWFLNNSELSTGGRHAVGLKDGVATLEIHDVLLTDSGNYTCEVLNECGCESCSIKVTVKEPPSIRKELLSTEAVRGSVAVLECEIAGSAPLEVSWKKNKKRLSSDKKYSIVSQGSLASLEIQSFESADTGEYECVVSNEVGSATSKSNLAGDYWGFWPDCWCKWLSAMLLTADLFVQMFNGQTALTDSVNLCFEYAMLTL